MMAVHLFTGIDWNEFKPSVTAGNVTHTLDSLRSDEQHRRHQCLSLWLWQNSPTQPLKCEMNRLCVSRGNGGRKVTNANCKNTFNQTAMGLNGLLNLSSLDFNLSTSNWSKIKWSELLFTFIISLYTLCNNSFYFIHVMYCVFQI